MKRLIKKINSLQKIIQRQEGESTIINIRNERGNIRANLLAIRKMIRILLCKKKKSKCKKEATGRLWVSKKGKKTLVEISFAQEETNDKLEMEEIDYLWFRYRVKGMEDWKRQKGVIEVGGVTLLSTFFCTVLTIKIYF